MFTTGRLAIIALCLFLGVSVSNAATLVGFLIYTPSAASDDSQAKVIAFSDIFWQSPTSGLITSMTGSTVAFNTSDITKYVYLDDAYWRAMNGNASLKPLRAGILDREIVIPSENSDVTSDQDLHSVIVGSQTIDSLIKIAPAYASALSPVKDALDQAATHYQNGERRFNGHWLSAKDYQTQALAAAAAKTENSNVPAPEGKTGPSSSGETWTTTDGVTYHNVVVVAQEADGVRITHADGAGKIPYTILPLDLQKRFGQDPDTLEAKRKLAEETQSQTTQTATPQPQQQGNGNASPPAAQPSTAPSSEAPAPPAVTTQSEVSPQPQAAGSSATSLQSTEQSGNQSTPPAAVLEASYNGSRYSYNSSEGVCYLDSFPVVLLPIWPEPADAQSSPQDQPTLTLRITTEGHRPEAPDRIEVIFSLASSFKKLPGKGNVKFLVDGNFVMISEVDDNNGAAPTTADQAPTHIAFYLPPEQRGAIVKGKNVNFIYGSNNYRIDSASLSTLQKYFADVDRLPPASSSLVRSWYKFYDQLPSMIDFISTTCVYIVIGAFVLGLVAVVAGVALGMSKILNP